ncbi:radical SAM protein [Magnetospirillum sp. SS-4]|uniref:radical SAM/SPASM domain-containing protein n=1 Tax=Magnetospirillum sp. SS-4 TaxID=2681465 RepID=UPI0013805DF2|nr:radical SAM protein [Magnetospirillum sp. SS-4]CAA7618340.1 putative Fe-S oxidoreductase [Magnetospirillum sp. SS-4]
MFTLIMRRSDGSAFRLVLDTSTSRLTDEAGRLIDISPLGVVYDNEGKTLRDAPVTTRDRAEPKSRSVKVLRIQLGLACNFSCAYCVQDRARPGHDEKSSDVAAFLNGLDEWISGAPVVVELWGGEPLLYWHKLKTLVEGLRCRWPEVKLRLTTNGSLLDMEKVDWLAGLRNISVTVSHDGPGQHLRGKDPLDDPETLAAIRSLFARLGTFAKFHAVMSLPHHSPIALLHYFFDRLGTTDIQVSSSGLKYPPTKDSRLHLVPGNPKEYTTMRHNLAREFRTPYVFANAIVAAPLRHLLYQFAKSVPARARGQGCNMDNPEHLAVTLSGDVIVCHNTSPATHRIGSVHDFAAIRLTHSISWHNRPECNSCPALLSCGGACMMMEGRERSFSCDNNFSHGLVYLATLLYALTGADLLRIEGRRIRHLGVTSFDF